jgi:hypothetical protein
VVETGWRSCSIYTKQMEMLGCLCHVRRPCKQKCGTGTGRGGCCAACSLRPRGRHVTSDADGLLQSISRKIISIPRSRDSSIPSLFVACIIMSLSSRLLRPAVRTPWRFTRVQRWRGYATVEVPASKLSFGQPLHETHPHLLKPGEGATTHGWLPQATAEQ